MARTVSVSGEDAKNSESAGSYKPYPDGNYIGEIIDVTTDTVKSEANKGLTRLNVKVKFTESNTGKGVGKKFVAWGVPDFSKWKTGGVAFEFYQFYKALGVQFPEGDGDVDLPDLEDLIGEEIGITLKTGGNLKGEPRNEVDRFFPASKGVGDSVAVADDAADEGDDFTL